MQAYKRMYRSTEATKKPAKLPDMMMLQTTRLFGDCSVKENPETSHQQLKDRKYSSPPG